MERLTIDELIAHCNRQLDRWPGGNKAYQEHESARAYLQILRHYIAIGTVEHLTELCKAESEGRVMVPPCKVGDAVYTNKTWSGDYERNKDKPYCHKVVFVGLNGEKDFFHTVNVKTERMFSFDFTDIGKTVFLTRQEAEAALEIRK